MPPKSFHLQLADGRQVPLDAEITIGREAPGGLELADPMVSRAHALVWRDGDAVFVRDLDSSNGTSVGGKRIAGPTRVKNGDQIRVGKTVLRVVERVEGSPELAAADRSAALPKQPVAAPGPGAKRSGIPRWVWAACGVLAAGGIVCVIALAAALILPSLFRGTGNDGAAPLEEAGAAETYSFGDPVITTLAADGSYGVDEHGVGAALSPGSLDAGGTAQLRRSTLGGELQDELAAGFEILSEAYSVAVEGELDAAGTAELRFPAPSPEARLAVILDDSYGGVLEITPAEGYLTVETHVGALSGTARGPSDVPQSARRYFVVVPRGAAGALNDAGGLAAPRSANGAQTQLRRCTLLVNVICLTDGVVYVHHTNTLAEDSTLTRTVAAVQAYMARYAELGINAARIGARNPVHINVGSYEEPGYSSTSGGIYLSWPQIHALNGGAAAARGTLAHELAHWIEDEEFVMFSAGISGLDYWWTEVAAECLAFLVEPEALQDTLFTYGRLQEEGDPRYALQLAPFTWSGRTNARYIQAIPVYVGLCGNPDACLFDRDGLVRAINEGTNPFAYGRLEGSYYRLLEDAARFLLGHPPAYTNTTIPIPGGLQSGDLANEWILVRESRGASTLEPYLDSRAPQMQVSGETARIEAPIEEGGLYSFRLSNTGRSLGIAAAGAPGLPAYLEIAPGAPFFFTIDNGPLHEGIGGRSMFLAPIHDLLGHGMVRLAAYAPGMPVTLQAEVGYIDLAGDWVTEDFRVTEATDTCGEAEEGYAWTQDIFLTALAAFGHFSRLETAGGEIPYTWVQDAGFPSGDETITASASARVTMQDVQVEYTIHIPEPQQSQLFRGIFASWPDDPAAGAGATAALSAVAVGVGALRLRVRRRRALVVVVIAVALLGLALAGCEMLTGFWGDISGRYVFRRVEYLSQDFTLIEEGDELWRLTNGEGQVTLNLTTVTTDFDTGEDTERQCQATVSSATDGLVLLENAVTTEDLGLE